MWVAGSDEGPSHLTTRGPVLHRRREMDDAQNPLISVVVTCHNYGRFLDDALTSVRNQTLNDWECFIVDDGSEDDTPAIALAWARRDPRFIHVRQENAGISAARNTGLGKARGQYIQFLDADDMILPNKFDIQAQLLGTLPENALVYSSYERLYDSSHAGPRSHELKPMVAGGPLLDSLILAWEKDWSVPPHCFMFRRSHFATEIAFDVDLVSHEDFDVYVKLAAAGVEFVHHDDVLAAYRIHGQNMSSDRTRMTSGYLRALEHAARRMSSRHDYLLVVYRFLAEFEQGLTAWIFRRNQTAELGSILVTQYGPLSALGLVSYPFLLLRRVAERSRRLIRSR